MNFINTTIRKSWCGLVVCNVVVGAICVCNAVLQNYHCYSSVIGVIGWATLLLVQSGARVHGCSRIRIDEMVEF